VRSNRQRARDTPSGAVSRAFDFLNHNPDASMQHIEHRNEGWCRNVLEFSKCALSNNCLTTDIIALLI